MSRVILAMSGGVDSSAAAFLLKQEGYDVVGVFMRSGVEAPATCNVDGLPIVSPRPHKQGCCSAADAADARRVADSLDIPFHAVNMQEDFRRIQDYFADEYLAGRTPNPCVMCNIWLKFGKLWEYADSVGAEFVASGHYARIRPDATGALGLYRGRDPDKDQSYVLFGMQRNRLADIRFPVGDMTKSEIRDLARRAGLRTADKPDSQEICFIPDNDYRGFLSRYRGECDTAGEIVDTAGNVVGEHPGYERFTIGQRRGLGVTFGAPRFVIRIEPEARRVVVGTKDELGCDSLVADQVNWLVDDVPRCFDCSAQIRYQHDPAACAVECCDDGSIQVSFDAPQFGVTPGQAVVLYRDEQVLGGGWIC